MRPFSHTIPIDEALHLVHQAAEPLDRVESVSLADAAGRVLARDVVAPADVPPFARSAMDGYAVLAADLADATADHQVVLDCTGTVYSGDALPAPLVTGTCVEIATGAPIPPGSDVAVVMVEETSRDGRAIGFTHWAQPGQNTSKQGSDLMSGQRVAAAGEPLTPARLGAVAATGASTVDVYARPRVIIVSTGNEIVGPGVPLRPGQIYDINRFTLTAIVGAHGGVSHALPAAGDSLEALRDAMDGIADSDLAIFSGGSSVGERDLMIDVLRERGDVLFHGIAVKPGKPTALARVGRTVVFAMPGNPSSCLSNAYIFLIPLLRRLARLPPHCPRQVSATLVNAVSSAPGRHQFYTVRLEGRQAVPAFKGSGDITSLSRADGYIEIPAEVLRLEAGTTVMVTLF